MKNFIDYMECDIDAKDISKLNEVIGIGTTLHKFSAINGDLLGNHACSYHLPSADVHLFSLQAYYQLYNGSSELNSNKVEMYLKQQNDLSVRQHQNSN